MAVLSLVSVSATGRGVGFDVEPEHGAGTGADVGAVLVEGGLDLLLSGNADAREVVNVVVGDTRGSGVVEVGQTVGVETTKRAITTDDDEVIAFVLEALVSANGVELRNVTAVNGGDEVDSHSGDEGEDNDGEESEDAH